MAERSPAEIQKDIDTARDRLAGTLDQLTERASPKRLVANGRQSVQDFMASPKGQAIAAGAGALLVLLIGRRMRVAKREKREKDIEFLLRYNGLK